MSQNKQVLFVQEMGIPEEREELCTGIIVETIKKMHKDGEEIDRLSVMKKCIAALPEDMSCNEMFVFGFIIQYKAQLFHDMLAEQEMKDQVLGIISSINGAEA